VDENVAQVVEVAALDASKKEITPHSSHRRWLVRPRIRTTAFGSHGIKTLLLTLLSENKLDHYSLHAQ
jgi:hypothetical protein